jgi:hypothetical protein
LLRELGEERDDLVVSVGETVEQRRLRVGHDHDNGAYGTNRQEN